MGPENIALIALSSLAVAAGDASRSRRAYIAEVEERARRAGRDRDAEACRPVAEERLRIARDLHDVVGHHLALINVQAGVADHVLTSRPDQARDALAHVRKATRAALDDVTATVSLLRQPGDPAVPVEPAASLAGLGELIERQHSIGRGHLDPRVRRGAAPAQPGRGHPGNRGFSLPVAASRAAQRVAASALATPPM